MIALLLVAGGLFLAYQIVKPPAVVSANRPKSAAEMGISMELWAHPNYKNRVPKDTTQGPEFIDMPQ